MTLNHIACDDRGMAGAQAFGHAEFILILHEAFAEQNFSIDLKTIFFQVHDPAVTALSGRRLIDRDRGSRRPILSMDERRKNKKCGVQQRHQQTSVNQSHVLFLFFGTNSKSTDCRVARQLD